VEVHMGAVVDMMVQISEVAPTHMEEVAVVSEEAHMAVVAVSEVAPVPMAAAAVVVENTAVQVSLISLNIPCI